MYRTLISLLLLALMAVPTARKLNHALSGHIKIHCNEDIPNHFHQGELNCDFHKFHFAPALEAPVSELSEPSVATFRCEMPVYIGTRAGRTLRYASLRAPPGLI